MEDLNPKIDFNFIMDSYIPTDMSSRSENNVIMFENLILKTYSNPNIESLSELNQEFVHFSDSFDESLLAKYPLQNVLVEILDSCNDIKLIKECLRCLVNIEINFPNVISSILDLKIIDSIFSLISTNERGFTSEVFDFLSELILNCESYRIDFYKDCSITNLYFYIVNSLDLINNESIARFSDYAVNYLPVFEEVIDIYMQIFQVILVQRWPNKQAGNHAQLYALHGIYTILQNNELTQRFKCHICNNNNIQKLIVIFFDGRELNNERVLAISIVAEMYRYNVQEIPDLIPQILESFDLCKLTFSYHIIALSLQKIIRYISEDEYYKLLENDIFNRLIKLQDSITFEAKASICDCLKELFYKMTPIQVKVFYQESFFSLFFSILEIDDLILISKTIDFLYIVCESAQKQNETDLIREIFNKIEAIDRLNEIKDIAELNPNLISEIEQIIKIYNE